MGAAKHIEQQDYGRSHDLTVEEVKACPAFAHFSDAQAAEVGEALKKFSEIVHNFYLRNTKKKRENP